MLFLKKMAKMALYNSPDYHKSFESNGLSLQEKKFNIDFPNSSHLGFPVEVFCYFWYTSHLYTSNEVSSQLTVGFGIKSSK